MSMRSKGTVLSAAWMITMALFVGGLSPATRGGVPDDGQKQALYAEYIRLLSLRAQDKWDVVREGMQTLILKDPTFTKAYTKIVEAYMKRKEADQAIAYFQGLLAEDPKNLNAYYALGLLYSGKGKPWLDNFKRCLEIDPTFVPIYETIGEKEATGITVNIVTIANNIIEVDDNGIEAAYFGLGRVYLLEQNWKKAFESFDKVLERNPTLIQAYESKVRIYAITGNASELLKVSLEGLALAEQMTDIEKQLTFLGSAAAAYYQLADYPKALYYANRALPLAIDLGHRRLEQEQLGRIGRIYLELNNYSDALSEMERALKICREIRYREGERLHLTNIGHLYQELGQHERAVEYFSEAMRLTKALGDKAAKPTELKIRAALLTNIGAAYQAAGDLLQALKYLGEAQVIAQKIGDKRTEGYINLYMGAVELERANHSRAVEFFERAYGIAQELGDLKLEGLALTYLGRVHMRLGKLSNAKRDYDQALAKGKGAGSGRLIAVGHAGLAAVYEKQNDLEKALTEYKHSVKAVDEVSGKQSTEEHKISLFHSLIDPYEGLNSLLVRMHRAHPSRGYDREAFKYAERAKARVMIEALRNPGGANQPEAAPIDVTTAQKQLDEKTLMLEYFMGRRLGLAFVLTKDDYKMYEIPMEEVSLLAKRYQASAKEPGSYSAYLTYTLSAHRLYNLLVKPAAELLRGKQRLLVVADGPLHYVPFGALLEEPVVLNGRVDFSKLPYLIRNFSIGHIQSAGVLKALRDSRVTRTVGRRQEVLVVSANAPDNFFRQKGHLQDGATFSSREVDAIAQIYDVNMVTYAEPTKAGVLQGLRKADFKGIHFAVCGTFDGRIPRLDLGCSGSSSASKYLHMDDILQLKLNADLVVLSACETGLGKDWKGEGLVGLSRAFTYAGASSVMVALWGISDKATAEFMVKFHKHWANAKKSEALRLASLDLIQTRYAHPFYWAAFVLFEGDAA